MHQSVVHPRTPDRGDGCVDPRSDFHNPRLLHSTSYVILSNREAPSLFFFVHHHHHHLLMHARQVPTRPVGQAGLSWQSGLPRVGMSGHRPSNEHTCLPYLHISMPNTQCPPASTNTSQDHRSTLSAQPDRLARKNLEMRRKKKGSDHQSVRPICLPSRAGDFPPAGALADWSSKLPFDFA
ncbi:hypothetical protein BO71DRAFT_114417 [Aspergillus ellipticus CBS 707.79]|uniref:Uncharacterized protein n=1 Tax=Aspergillus ellipticus CBS 707.79 TaxID=1448320 RepID=A0A319E1L8_9EURO|nr:hypothetical protein BO71DRAFT_114417 [Aspergillus ellipticus CBS 707.79]